MGELKLMQQGGGGGPAGSPAPGPFRWARELVQVWRAWRAAPASQLRWGMPWLERVLGQPFPGGMLVVGARTNVGKSFWVLELGAALCAAGYRVAYLSAEDAPHEVGRRLELVGAPTTLLTGFPDARLSAVVDHIEAAGRAGAQFVIVDYLQVLGWDGDVQVFGDAGALTRTTIELKAACKRAGVVGVLVSQLRRAPQFGGGAPAMPTLSELKGSGAIEETAEWVVLLASSRDRKRVRAAVAKSKNGAVGATRKFVRGEGGRLVEQDGQDEEHDDELDD